MILRVRGIKRFRRKGRWYCYHRRTGKRIEAEYGTEAFALEVMRLNGQPVGSVQHAAGTLGALIAAYRESPEFQGLAPRTRKDYQRVFDYLKPIDDLAVERITSKGILDARDKAFKKHKRRFANYLVQVYSLIFKWGKPRGWCPSNPAEGVPMIRRPKDMAPANRPWSDAELETILERAPRSIRLAVMIGVHTGLREGDVIRLLWSAYDGRVIRARQSKTGQAIEIPAHHRLKAALDSETRREAVIVLGERGRPFTSNGFQSRFFKFIAKLEAEGAVQPGLTFHGLRHSIGKKLAEAGCDTRTIAAVLGHQTEDMARHYAKEEDARRRTSAAIKKLERKADKSVKPQR